MQANNDKTIEEINKLALENNIYPSKAALMLGISMWNHPSLWPDIKRLAESKNEMKVDLIGGYDCEFTRMVTEVAERQKFPINTTFLHSLGVVGSATLISFNVSIWDTLKPCTIYTCCSQPSGSGKSPVHDVFTTPILDEIIKINKENGKKKYKLKVKMDDVKSEMKGNTNKVAKAALMEDLLVLEDESLAFNKMKYMSKNATPQVLEEIAQANGGSWSVVSDEKEAMDKVLGSDFGAAEALQDFGLILSGYDGGYYSSDRITRKGFDGRSRGSINVMAQKSTVEKLLFVGSNGRGINERFYLLCEKPRFGEGLDEWVPLNPQLKQWYETLIDNILNSREITLSIKPNDIKKLTSLANKNRKKFGEGGSYDNNMARGFVAKKPLMIAKIASILHIMRYWASSGDRKTEIDSDCIDRAIHIDDQLTSAYMKVLYEYNHGGTINQSLRVVDYLDGQVQKNKIKTKVSVRKIYDSVRKSPEFKQIDECMSTLKTKVLKQLEEFGYGFEYDNNFYLNPKFKD